MSTWERNRPRKFTCKTCGKKYPNPGAVYNHMIDDHRMPDHRRDRSVATKRKNQLAAKKSARKAPKKAATRRASRKKATPRRRRRTSAAERVRKFCTMCGEKLGQDWIYCGGCGGKL